MAQAIGFIPQSDPYSIPQGLTLGSTPQGGTAYLDQNGTYGVKGSMYVRGANGFTLATSLPGSSGGNVSVGAPGTTIAQAPASSPAPTTPATTQPTAPTKTPAEIQSEADATLNAPMGDDEASGTRTSASIESEFENQLAQIGTPPTAPDANAEQSSLSDEYGVASIQSNIDTLNSQIDALTTQELNQGAGMAKPGITASTFRASVGAMSAQSAVQIKQWQDQVKSYTTQLNNANSAIKSIMANNQQSYTDAEKSYTDQYNNAYKLFTTEESQLTKDEASANANAKVIISSFKGQSNVKITPDQEAQWNAIETQAGLPTGFIQSAIQAESTSGVKISHWVTGKDGSLYAYGTDANGNPALLGVLPAGGSTKSNAAPSNGAWTKTQFNTNVNKMSSALESSAGSDGFVSDGTWNQALQDWISAGGTAKDFTTQFKQYKSTNASAGNS